MKKYYFLTVAFCFGLACEAQIINFPDVNLKSRLLTVASAIDVTNNYISIDSNGDGEITVAEAQLVYKLGVYGALSGYTNLIANMEGIQYFTNLRELNCQENLIQTLDLSGLIHLTTLYCYNNRLQSLNLSGLTSLTEVNAGQNRIASVAAINLSGTNHLEKLVLSVNLMSTFNASTLPNSITELDFSYNQIANVNLNGLTNLGELRCYNNQLATINMAGLPGLHHILCGSNQITTLDFSQNPLLTNIYASDNLLTTINLSQNHQMFYLDLRYNLLTSMYLENGANEMSGINMTLSTNPNLAFICADAFEMATLQNWITSLNLTNCTVSISCNLSRQGFDVDSYFTLSPIPTKEILNIRPNGNRTVNAVKIYNALGALIQITKNSETIDVSRFKTGIYYVQITTDKGTANAKFIKE